MALFFALGSTCFLIGPFPGYAQLVGATADAVTFFIRSILFTAGGTLQTLIAFPERRSPGAGRAAWWAATVQSAGTLFFNVTTYQALQTSLFFGISAIAGYVVPSTGSIIDLAAANWNTALGAACFLACALATLLTNRTFKSPRLHALEHDVGQLA